MVMTLQTLMPTVITPSSQTAVTDIDHDGTNELIVLDGDIQQLTIIHQFRYSDMTLNQISPTIWPTKTDSLWPSYTNPQWRTWWTAPQGVVPAGVGFTPWTLQTGDQILAADFDGDTYQELFIYNLAASRWGMLKWNSTTNQLETIFNQVITPPSSVFYPPLTVTWDISQSDQYQLIPNMTGIVPAVHGVGILAYNPSTKQVGLLSYQAATATAPATFLQWWQNFDEPLNNWNLANSSNTFCVSNFAAGGTPSFAVYGPSDQYIALLTWNGSALGATYQAQHGTIGGNGNWVLQSGDQLQCADLNGDGLAEILIYSTGGYLGVLQWNKSSNQWQTGTVTGGTIKTGSNSWTIGGNDTYVCQNGASNNPGYIFAFSSNPLAAAVLQFQKSSGSFTCLWSGTSLTANNAWPIAATDTFYAAAPYNATAPTLFTLSNQGSASSPKIKLGAVTWNTANVQIPSSVGVPIQPWSPQFLAGAPQLGFKQFTEGDQAAIYTYISNQFPLPTAPLSPHITAVRDIYTIASNSTLFANYAGAISVAQKPSEIPSTWRIQPPAGVNWSDDDWGHVMDTITKECLAVSTVYGMSGAVAGITSNLHTYQHSDWKKVHDNLKAAQQAAPGAGSYWEGQIGVALLWGFAAAGSFLFPEAPLMAAAFGVFGSMTASAWGSVAGYNPGRQGSYSVTEIETSVLQTYAQQISDQSADLTAFLQDAIKLNICYKLNDNQWKIDTSLASTAQVPFQTMDRIWMYQQAIPAYFNIPIFSIAQDPNSDYALFSSGTWGYGLGVNSSYFTKSEFSNLLMYSDLFTTLNVSKADFFLGVGGWANIRRFVLNTQIPPVNNVSS